MSATPENEKAIAAQILCAILNARLVVESADKFMAAEKPRYSDNLESLWRRVLEMVGTEAPGATNG